jgi:gliding motility-associated-like protein
MPKPLRVCFSLCVLITISPFAIGQSFKKQGTLLPIFGERTNLGNPSPFTKKLFSGSNGLSTVVPLCSTTTFLLRISASANEKVVLSKLQTFPDGNFLAIGTITLSSGEKEGILVLLANNGNILSQKRIRVANHSTILTDGIMTAAGDVYICGTYADGTTAFFLARGKEDLTFTWINSVPVSEVPAKVVLDFSEFNKIFVGAQLSTSVYCATYDTNGNSFWQSQLAPSSITELVGVATVNGAFRIVTNCIYNAKPAIQEFEINEVNGNVIATNVVGNGNEENKCFDVTPMGNRYNILGVNKTSASIYVPFRHNTYYTANTETVHTYQLPANIDFSCSGAMDDAGDALGYFIPTTRQLVFIKHFSAYYTTPEFCKQYSVSNASSIASIARSYDGGFLFGLNSTNAAEWILIKTDSVGTLPTCGFQTLNISTTQTFNVPNTAASAGVNSLAYSRTTEAASITNLSLNGMFDCEQVFCPPPVPDDSCLATYYKLYRSSSYITAMGQYSLMRNNNQLVESYKLDRVMSGNDQVTYGLKLLDERGYVQKAVELYNDTTSISFNTFRVDDQRVMLVINASSGIEQQTNFTLVNDQLQIVWSKTFSTQSDFYSAGVGVSDIYEDAQGNFYAVGTKIGFLTDQPKIFIFKMDAFGNQIWLRGWNLNSSQSLGMAAITCSTNDIIVYSQGSGLGGVLLRADKNSGTLESVTNFPINWDGSVTRPFLNYYAGKIFLADHDNQARTVLSILDSTAKPLRIKVLEATPSIIRAADFKNGFFFANYQYYGVDYKEGILKVDSALHIQFLNLYPDIHYRMCRGIGVSDAGFIYVGGTYYYGGMSQVYGDAYLMKLDSAGNLGSCTTVPSAITTTDITPDVLSITSSPISHTYSTITSPVHIVDATDEFNISQLLCSSHSECSFIDVIPPPPVCELNVDDTIRYVKNAGCTLKPQWTFDSTVAQLQAVTDSTVIFRFKKPGINWIKATLNTTCKLYADSVQVRVSPDGGSLNLGADRNICAGDSILLHAGSQFISYVWQDGSTDSVFLAKQAGTYFVRVQTACGNWFGDTIQISAANVPILSLGPDFNACAHDTLTIQASAGFQNYFWKSSLPVLGQGAIVRIVATSDGFISVNANTVDGCRAYDTVLLHVITAKPIDLGRDTSFCQGDSIVLNAGNGYVKYQWSNGSSQSSIVVNRAGSYNVTAKDANGCFARDTLAVLQTYNVPVVDLGADKDLCTGIVLQLDAGNFSSYLWQDGSTNRYLHVNNVGKYWVAVRDFHQCEGSDTLSIGKLLPLPSQFLKAGDTICQYGKLTITPTGYYNNYSWSTGSSERSITISKGGLYVLTVTNNLGCMGADSTVIVQRLDCLTGLFIPNAFTPNADGKDDIFKPVVHGPLVKYSMSIFNRWGQLVFSSIDPYSGWNGTLAGKLCDGGNYVWQCSYQFEGQQPVFEKGNLLLLR